MKSCPYITTKIKAAFMKTVGYVPDVAMEELLSKYSYLNFNNL